MGLASNFPSVPHVSGVQLFNTTTFNSKIYPYIRTVSSSFLRWVLQNMWHPGSTYCNMCAWFVAVGDLCGARQRKKRSDWMWSEVSDAACCSYIRSKQKATYGNLTVPCFLRRILTANLPAAPQKKMR